MALSQRIQVRQTQAQTLVMTPQLQQAIKLLQLSNVELAAYVDGEIERNPLLEREDPDGGAPVDGPGSGPEAEAGAFETADLTGIDRLTAAGVAEDGPLDTTYDNLYTNSGQTGADDRGFDVDSAPDRAGSARAGAGGASADEGTVIERTLAAAIGFRDCVQRQINQEFQAPEERRIAAALADLLDEAGYLREPVAGLAARLGVGPERLAGILARLKEFEPTGLFAADLAECLSLQLAERDRLDPAMARLLDNLPLLARQDYPALTRLCGVDREDLAEMIAEIRALDPKPAARFSETVAQTVLPDVLMRALPAGGWGVELNADTLPRVLVNQRYYAAVAKAATDKSSRDFISEALASGNWLVKSLHQRATTILKVATAIIAEQDGFFRHGVSHLRPLILRDIADTIGMHESTVSRVTTNKFMATPRGMFELKYFFTATIGGTDGAAAHSAEAVRHRIRTLVDREDPGAILSDDRIVEILRSHGIEIARRTVAKYREAMMIPSSVHRRRDKSMRR